MRTSSSSFCLYCSTSSPSVTQQFCSRLEGSKKPRWLHAHVRMMHVDVCDEHIWKKGWVQGQITSSLCAENVFFLLFQLPFFNSGSHPRSSQNACQKPCLFSPSFYFWNLTHLGLFFPSLYSPPPFCSFTPPEEGEGSKCKGSEVSYTAYSNRHTHTHTHFKSVSEPHHTGTKGHGQTLACL